MRVPEQLVIRDEAAWRALWRRHAGPSAGPAPLVDFGRTMVLAVFAGESPPSAALGIVRITVASDRLAVWYMFRETRPLPAAEIGGSSAPYHIVKLARSSLPVSFFQIATPPVLRRSAP